MNRTLGVCYYPEHWPESQWTEDAERMAALGLTHVRIGEFAWSRLEPKRGAYEFDWLRRAIDTLHGAGLKVVLGTPTATPPKWLVDEMPDMLPVGADGSVRGFGSRRHYCFSHDGYRKRHPHHRGAGRALWPAPGPRRLADRQRICLPRHHAESYSDAARAAFRDWLAQKYQSSRCAQPGLGQRVLVDGVSEFRPDRPAEPDGDGAEPGPCDRFPPLLLRPGGAVQQGQADIIRAHSSDAPISHNYMGRTLDFDHFAVGAQIWISRAGTAIRWVFSKTAPTRRCTGSAVRAAGRPGFPGLPPRSLPRTSKGRWWVMEQQPGPVNWAPHNPAPRDGMVRLWSWEAFAHGAECVSYFRWRQAPFAQEQMHAGLLRPDSAEAEGHFARRAQVAGELGKA
jgi:beta-galactosidase